MKKIFSALVVALVAGSAFGGTVPGTCSINDVTYAYACDGAFSGNDTGNAVVLANTVSQFDTLDPFALAGTWQLVDKTDGTDGTQAVTFLGSNPSGTSGMLTFSQAISDIFGISIKAGNYYNIYMIDGGFVSGGVTSVDFSTANIATNTHGVPLGVSHASLWGFSQSGNFGGSCELGNDCVVTNVPEPGTMALMLSGILGVGAAARRRKNSKK